MIPCCLIRSATGAVMMGRQTVDQSQLFYLLNLEEHIPAHLPRARYVRLEGRAAGWLSRRKMVRLEWSDGQRPVAKLG
jgi:hypothetical protein